MLDTVGGCAGDGLREPARGSQGLGSEEPPRVRRRALRRPAAKAPPKRVRRFGMREPPSRGLPQRPVRGSPPKAQLTDLAAPPPHRWGTALTGGWLVHRIRWTRAHGGAAGAWRDPANLRCRGADVQRAGTCPRPKRRTSNAPRPIPARLEVGRAGRGQRPTPTHQRRRDRKLTARRMVCGRGDGGGRRPRGAVPRTGRLRSRAPVASGPAHRSPPRSTRAPPGRRRSPRRPAPRPRPGSPPRVERGLERAVRRGRAARRRAERSGGSGRPRLPRQLGAERRPRTPPSRTPRPARSATPNARSTDTAGC